MSKKTKDQSSEKSRLSRCLSILLLLIFAAVYFYIQYGAGSSGGSNGNLPGNGGNQQVVFPEQYDGNALEVLNDNIPTLGEDLLTTESYEQYGKLDSLGRCTTAVACLSRDTMPASGTKRGDISDIHPSGWKSGMGWERCHLIAWSLSDESANERNLITGTHTMNQAMLPYEEATVQYIRDTGNHVIYQVTPDFEGNNLVASGVQMQAVSVEDHGRGISFNIYCHNITEGATIDYATGAVLIDADVAKEVAEEYVLNTNSMKFHRPDCEGVHDIYKRNRKTVTEKRSELIREGYEPCGICQP